jgi:hypothetical protein
MIDPVVQQCASGILMPYLCSGFNRRTQRICGVVLVEAWSAAGAVVRRRCKQCGTWQDIWIVPTPPEGDAAC